MKRTKLSVFAAITFFTLTAVADDINDSQLATMATDLKALVLVTKEPHPMADSTVAACRPAGEGPHNIHEGFRNSYFCNVYVSDSAKQTMLSGSGRYPVGALIVKSKLQAKDAVVVELYTVMRKMADGYNPKNGNWEYSVIDGRSKRIVSRGKIESCIACHNAYQRTDFVTRAYIPDSSKQKPASESANQPVAKEKSSPPAK